ncbi:chorismate mutase [Vallitalea sp.]|jgi:monofunctional chorismate mutase|uniref:chorismate mutase n=1 Tax=Vallitalea sp. TaxID=1882829 RepID=UPI0025F0FF3A|nr:chorismate mutase [Vallitalea sp.]MCT4688317.1 chorismate mutase [Vallitalea sp.]
MVSIRGAITIDTNTKENIINDTKTLLKDILISNNINNDQIISIIFSATKDLTAAYPAIGAREIGIVDASLMCVSEMYVENSLEMCIRVMVTVNIPKSQNEVKHIYLKKAKSLRPDLLDKMN